MTGTAGVSVHVHLVQIVELRLVSAKTEVSTLTNRVLDVIH